MARRAFLERRDLIMVRQSELSALCGFASSPRVDIGKLSDSVWDAVDSLKSLAFPYVMEGKPSRPPEADFDAYFDELDELERDKGNPDLVK